MKVKYIGPSDAVYVAVLGEDREFRRNHPEEVDDAIAGRPPEPRLRVAMEELHAAITDHNHEVANKFRQEIGTLDYGDGLLAQNETWQAVTPKAAPPKEDEK